MCGDHPQWLKKPTRGRAELHESQGARGKRKGTREASAARGAAFCALRSGLACEFALRARVRGAPRAAASVGARVHACRALVGLPCALECAVRMECVHLIEMLCMCALPARLAHRERADRGNGRVARAAMCAARSAALPF